MFAKKKTMMVVEVVAGLAMSMIWAAVALCAIKVTLPGRECTYGDADNPWFDEVVVAGPVFGNGAYQMESNRLQFSARKFVSSCEGQVVIVLLLGSAGFLIVAGVAGHGLVIMGTKRGRVSPPLPFHGPAR